MKLLQVDEQGEVVADLGPPVPDAAPKIFSGLAARVGGVPITAMATSDVDCDVPPTTNHAPPLRQAPRLSLDCEAEVHAHLAPRVEAHVRRVMGFNLDGTPRELRENIAEHTARVLEGMRVIGRELGQLQGLGCDVRATASSRKRAALKCAIGKRVQLRADIGDEMCGLFYSAEELSALTLSKVGESSVLLTTAGGREIGPLPFAHVELVE